MPNGVELPPLEQPPSVIEGAGGGPAVPTGGGGGGKTEEEQEVIEDAGEVITGTGGAIVVAGAGMAATGVGAPAAPGVGVIGLLVALVGQIVGFLADDPPQPFEKLVTFKRRVSPVPDLSDPALTPLGVASQRSVFTLVTTQGCLDALERLAAAQDARDFNWAITQNGVALQCQPAFVVDLATLAAALFAAAPSLKGSEYDQELKPGGTAVKDWIAGPGVEQRFTEDLEKAGLTPAETKRAIELAKANAVYNGTATSLSDELTDSSQKLYGLAEKLHR